MLAEMQLPVSERFTDTAFSVSFCETSLALSGSGCPQARSQYTAYMAARLMRHTSLIQVQLGIPRTLYSLFIS
jgi:hypothetical protein